MTKLLFVQASPREAESKSILIAETYLGALRASNQNLEIDTIELRDSDLPAFDGNKAAKINLIAGWDQNDVHKTAWDEIVDIANRFISADRYLFAVPMWNGIPYRLKQYIDIIHQPGLRLGLKPETGYFGLLENKHATLVLTSGAYSQHFPVAGIRVNHHSTYLHVWLNQAGVTEIDEVRFQPTLLTEDPAGDLERAKERVVKLAQGQGRV